MTTVTKERPILFSGPMVRAILDGRKTQTRRVLSLGDWRISCWAPDFVEHRRTGQKSRLLDVCPYGEPGGRLWVRETFAPRADVNPAEEPEKARHYCLYRADGGDPPGHGGHWHYFGEHWKPAIHMPRVLSRLTLEVTGVRVERLTAISSADCVAEGIAPTMRNDAPSKERFYDLWEKINGKRPGCSWADNPWVWCIDFKRSEGPCDELH